MSHYFDIKPPTHRSITKLKPYSAKKSKINKSGIMFFFIFIFLAIILYYGINLNGNNNNNTKSLQKSTQNQDNVNALGAIQTKMPGQTENNSYSSAPKTESPSVSANLSENNVTSENIQITVLNGGAGAGAANKAKTILEENSIRVYKTGNAQNNYSSTVIYYTNVNKSLAEKISETLADYNPKLEEDKMVVNDEDIIIVIGGK